MDPYSISKLSAKYQFCAIYTADNKDGKVTGGGYFFAAGYFFARHRGRAVPGHVVLALCLPGLCPICAKIRFQHAVILESALWTSFNVLSRPKLNQCLPILRQFSQLFQISTLQKEWRRMLWRVRSKCCDSSKYCGGGPLRPGTRLKNILWNVYVHVCIQSLIQQHTLLILLICMSMTLCYESTIAFMCQPMALFEYNCNPLQGTS